MRGGRIYFLYVPTEWYSGFSAKYHREMSECWDFFHVIPPKKKLGFPKDSQSMDIDCIWYTAIEDTLKWLSASVNFDAVICHYIFLSKAFTFLPDNVFKILYTHDRFSDRAKVLSDQGLKPDYFYTSRSEEGRAFDRADLVVAVKNTEADFFKNLSGTPVMTIGHAGQPTPVPFKPIQGRNIKIGFIGSENAVNAENINKFLSLYNDALSELKNIEMVFAGRICNLINAGSLPHKMLGMVDSVTTFYEEVDLVFVPFTFSTGIKIKAIEAMAHHVPIIMTHNAADGLPVRAAEHQCSNLDAFFEILRNISKNPDTLITLQKESENIYKLIRQEIDHSIDEIIFTIKHQGK